MRTFLIAALAALAAPAAAAERGLTSPSFLPDDAKTLEGLEASPPLMEARAVLGGARAQARMLAAGDHETTLIAALDQRRVRNDGSYSEWSVQASRAIRLPGKAALDRAAGEAGIVAAQNGLEDARHQASLALAESWAGTSQQA